MGWRGGKGTRRVPLSSWGSGQDWIVCTGGGLTSLGSGVEWVLQRGGLTNWGRGVEWVLQRGCLNSWGRRVDEYYLEES